MDAQDAPGAVVGGRAARPDTAMPGHKYSTWPGSVAGLPLAPSGARTMHASEASTARTACKLDAHRPAALRLAACWRATRAALRTVYQALKQAMGDRCSGRTEFRS